MHQYKIRFQPHNSRRWYRLRPDMEHHRRYYEVPSVQSALDLMQENEDVFSVMVETDDGIVWIESFGNRWLEDRAFTFAQRGKAA